MRLILKKVLRFFIFLSIVASLGAFALFVVSQFYGERVKQLFVDELTKRLTVELKVETIDFDVFGNFPYASVQFKKVVSVDKLDPNKFPLMKAEEISFVFSLYDLFRKNYKIERLILRDAFLNPEIAENGNRNFDLFNRKEENRSKQFELSLQKFFFRNVEVAYQNYPADQEFLFFIKNGDLKGNFISGSFDMLFSGDIQTTYIKSGKMTILRERELDVKLNLFYDHLSERLITKTGNIKSEGMRFAISGFIDTREKDQGLDIKVVSGKASVESFLDLIPVEFQQPLSDYKITGEIGFEVTARGPYTGEKVPAIIIRFDFGKGNIKYPASGFEMKKVFFSGSFNNGGKREEKFYSVEVKDIKAQIRGGTLSGNLTIRDFSRPDVNVQLQSTFDLKELKSIYTIEQLEAIQGKLELNLSFSNQLQDFRNFTMEDFLSSKTSGNMSFRDLKFKVKGNSLQYTDFDGNFRFSNKDLIIDSFKGDVSGNDFSMTGYFTNILAYAFRPDEKLYIKANMTSKQIDLDRLLAYKHQPDDSPYNLNLSESVDFDMQVNFESFRFRKFSGQNLQGKLTQRDQKFSVSDGRLKAMDGLISLSGTIDGKKGNDYLVTCNALFSDVDIHKCFQNFGDFRQDNLTHKNLSGTVTAKVYYSSTLTPALYVNPASVFTLADITINNGQLIGYTPLYALSRFVKQEELEHIRFSTLKNNIRIDKRVIHIPQMEINSNTLNLTLYGTHDFDNVTDYHIQLYLSELLSRRQREPERIDGIFEKERQDGKPRLFLSMTGPADNPAIRYDTREVRKKISSDVAAERETLREVIRDEFSWITGQNKQNKEEEDLYARTGTVDFVFYWDEVKIDTVTKQNTTEKTRVLKPKNKKTEKDFIIRWDED